MPRARRCADARRKQGLLFSTKLWSGHNPRRSKARQGKQFFFEKKNQKTFGRAVAVLSGEAATAVQTSFGFAGYCASKSALNMLTVKLAKELLAHGIKVNAADPGFTGGFFHDGHAAQNRNRW